MIYLEDYLELPNQQVVLRFAETLRYIQDSNIRPVDWRWRLAQLVWGHEEFKRLAKQPFTKKIIRFVQKLYSACNAGSIADIIKLRNKEPALFEAWQIYENTDLRRKRIELEARILAREPVADVLQKLGISQAVYEAYQQGFYDVKEKLDNISYILHCAIFNGCSVFTIDTEEKLIPFLGYMFGSQAVDFMINRVDKQKSWEEFCATLSEQAKEQIVMRWWAAAQSDDQELLQTMQKLYTGLQLANETTEIGRAVGDVREYVENLFSWKMPVQKPLQQKQVPTDDN